MKSLAFGEILWDIIEGKPHLGGAPFNVAAHLAQLGAQSFILSAVARDRLGNEAVAQAAKLGVNPSFIYRDSDLPTGTVNVFLNNGQPDYTIHEGVAWDEIPYKPDSDTAKEAWDTLIFGSLAMRTENNIQSITKLLAHNTFNTIFYDINLRKDYYSKDLFEAGFSLCNILKLNEDEVKVVSDLVLGYSPDEAEFAKEIAEQFNIGIVLITKGAEGAFAYTNNNKYSVNAETITIADTVGAGDSFSAAFLYTLHHTGNIQKALSNASKMGGFVASQSGAIPTYSPELKTLFS